MFYILTDMFFVYIRINSAKIFTYLLLLFCRVIFQYLYQENIVNGIFLLLLSIVTVISLLLYQRRVFFAIIFFSLIGGHIVFVVIFNWNFGEKSCVIVWRKFLATRDFFIYCFDFVIRNDKKSTGND